MVLKSGLEIHQQLNTKKLFCECPSVLRQDNPDYIVHRKLHPVPGESGEIDEAAKYEALKKMDFVYEGYRENSCLVELDEEPPHEISQDALRIVVQISLLLNCEIVPLTQIMRKTVIDGSNTSGFQRTVLIAKNGYVETESGKVRVDSVCLEEDSARIIKREKGRIVYRLDRLGIPLIEIATAPDIKSSEQAKEVALHIGEILRSCDVKRGLGTVRQDVNLSVEGGQRIEVKGVQDPALIKKTIDIEIERQKKLVKEGNSVSEVRKAEPNGETSFLRPMPGAARMYPETDHQILRLSRDYINFIKKSLPRLKKDIRKELEGKGLHVELSKMVLESGRFDDFKELMGVIKKPALIAKMLALWPKEIAVKENKKLDSVLRILHIDILESILQEIEKGNLEESDVKNVLTELVRGKELKEAMRKESVEDLEEEIMKIVSEKKGLTEKAYMGLVMAKLKGKASGKDIMRILKRILK